jgi:putative tricarboxylic transport membrane protein
MSEGIRPAAGREGRRLTTGHHRLDWWAGLLPLVMAAFAFHTARYFEATSSIGLFLWIFGGALALLGLVILGLRVHVPNHRDYYGGLALVMLALLAFWAGSDLAGMRGFSFGAGTAPRLFASALAVVAAIITVKGLVTTAPPVGGYAVRGPLFVTLAIVAFAILIRDHVFQWNGAVVRIPPMGLIIASFVTFVIAAVASKESRPIEVLITAAGLTVFCWFVFVWLLGLPFQLWPRF